MEVDEASVEPSADETATVPPLTPPLPLAVKPMELLVSPDSQNNNRAEGGGDQQTLSSQQDSSVDQRVTTTRLYADGLLFLSTVDHSMPECSDAPLVSDNLSSVCDLLPSVSSVKLLTGDSAGPISFTVTSEPPVPSGAELLQQQLNVCLSCLQIFPSVEVLTGHGELKHNASGILPRTNDWPSAMLFEDSDGPKLRFLRASLQSSCPDDSEAVSATTSQQNSMTSGCDDPTSPTALRQPDGLEPDLKRPEVPISPEELARNLKLASEMSASRILQQKAVRQANFQQFGSFDRTPTPCQLHPEGKSAGVECPKCEMVLGSSRSLGGHITMMHSRNSCKTLKCPKCNWHYKYQETLEIHMKEKHPENDVSCIYCLTNQSHPRLARGETYGCGYKPYRCDICKYSTTTKGNLSIHMQSDKHLNNVQELQQGKLISDPTALIHIQRPTSPVVSDSVTTTMATVTPTSVMSSTMPVSGSKPKPSWRCDVCNYETNVARNLRIHMTSEKHTHNSLLLQQNLSQLQQGLVANLTTSTSSCDPSALSQMSSSQLDSEMFNSGDKASVDHPFESAQSLGAIGPDSRLYQCCVCCTFDTDSLDELLAHIHADRSQTNESDISVVAGNYVCNLCQYKTHLKANFQLHTKTDKHLQRLQLVNHIREGGGDNEWRMKYLSSSNPVQLRCNGCYEFTNSYPKLQMHTTTVRHECYTRSFQEIQQTECVSDTQYFFCYLCSYASQKRESIIGHLHSARHGESMGKILASISSEAALESAHNWIQLKEMRDCDNVDLSGDEIEEPERNCQPDDLNDIEGDRSLSSWPANMTDDAIHCCSHCDFTATTEALLKSHVGQKHPQKSVLSCPLCQSECGESLTSIQKHLEEVHNVLPEAIERLMVLLPSSSEDSVKEENFTAASPEGTELADSFACPTCSAVHNSLDELYTHQRDSEHLELKATPRGPGYLCWQKGCNQYFTSTDAVQTHYREIHAKKTICDRNAYKFRCGQCSLAFRSEDKLELHTQYHQIRDSTKCVSCNRNFRTLDSLKKHLAISHIGVAAADEQRLKLAEELSDSPLTDSVGDLDGSRSECDSETNPSGENVSPNGELSSVDEYLNSQQMAEGNYQDPNRKFKCHRCKVAFTKQSYLTAHNKTLFHRRGEKLNFSLEKYLDPSRPYKCDVCKESFTQKNILVVHYNSVSHLHRLKKSLQEQNPSGTPQPSDDEVQSHTGTTSPAITTAEVSQSKALPTVANGGSGEDKLVTSRVQPQIPSPQLPNSTAAKPYKCNICRVSYNQSSTLDIHMRSVAHQSRSNKLKELIASGEVNINEPLIEKGDSHSATKRILGGVIAQKQLQQQQQHNKVSTAQQSLNTNQATTMMALANMASLAPYLSAQGLSNSLLLGQMVQNSLSNAEALVHLNNLSQLTCRACGIICSNKEGLEIHQKNVCKQQSSHQTDPARIKSETPGSEDDLMDVDYSRHSQLDPTTYGKTAIGGRSIPRGRIFHKLLEDYGFEVVMQYNESTQRVKRKRDESQRDSNEEIPEEKRLKIDESEGQSVSEPTELVSNKENQPKNGLNLPPEMTKCFCGQCQKQFSSIWVLKAHIEQAHKELVPSEEIDKVTEEFREAFEKKRQSSTISEKIVTEPTCTPTSVITSVTPTPAKAELSRSTSGKSGVSHAQPAANSLTGAQQHFLNNQYQSQAALAQVAAMANLQSFSGAGGFMGWPFGFGSPFMPFMPGSFDGSSAAGQMDANQSSAGRSNSNSAAMAAAAAAAAANQQKRARTRITDDQLKVLREYFDINNSPSEEQVEEMSRKSALPAKVIKHWFRNTLFKERQKNKDSPYNFNVPPAYSIDLEEYEKTGETRVISINPPSAAAPTDKVKTEQSDSPATASLPTGSSLKGKFTSVKQEVDEDMKDWNTAVPLQQQRQSGLVDNNRATVAAAMKAEIPSTPVSTPSPNLPSAAETLLQRLTTNMPPSQYQRPQQTSASENDSTSTSISQLIASALSPGSDSLTSPGGRRANRTRFSDEQLRILQEFFERNAYPKDDDLETLSKQLGLSPRVIVVWFQNARQKARKLYENQPAEPDERFIRTPGLNYECKKCHLVFQRYYELIKHQKTLCYREEEARLAALKVTTTNGSDGASGSNYSPTNSCGDESDSELNNSHLIKCEKCHAVFNTDAQLSAHLRSHHEPDKIQPLTIAEMPKPAEAEAKATSKHQLSDLTIEYSMQEGGPKRQRTQILPEQLDLLYQKYSADSNPSGKNLEQISFETGLNKRVVQVWFQNTRARDRKGQLSQQLFNKRCPFCGILFHSKPSMEGHIRERHAEQGLRGPEVNIDQLPNAEEVPTITAVSVPSETEGVKDAQADVVQSLLSLGMLPTSTSDILAKMATELQNKPANQDLLYWLQKATGGTSTSAATGGGEPMDLSQLKSGKNGNAEAQPNTNRTPSSAGGNVSGAEENDDDTQSSYSYETHSPQLSSPPGGFSRPQKRFRTHLSSGQIKIMKELFTDYKTPTMSECELLGTQIGLHKRVVQVWFQNARAKERKKQLDPSVDILHPAPEGCKACGIVYTAKHSVQDHIFTRGHIDKLRGTLKESERHKAEGNGQRGTSTNSAVLEQLQAQLGTNKSILGNNITAPSSSSRKRVESTAASKTQKPASNGGTAEFDDLSLLPLMYAGGQGGMGLNPAALYASLASSMMSYGALQGMPGNGLLYDPNIHGTPVQMLQIPPAVMQTISARMQNTKIPSVKFTQDGKTFDELKTTKNGKIANEAEIEVGWGCRTCHTVFPSEALHNNHRRLVCQSKESAFKLIQIHYECAACSERFGAQADFKSHCDSPGHRAKVANFRPL